MKRISIKKLMTRVGAPILAAVIAMSSAVSVSAAANFTTSSGDTVQRISNPNGLPGDIDGYINDREVGYGWSLAERDGYLYIGGWRNTVGAVIQHYLESALVSSGKMDSETVWNLTNIITNGEVPKPTNENGGVLIKMNRDNPGDFEIIAEMQDPFRHVAKYENDLYFATYVGVSGNDPKIYKLDENDKLTEVYTTAQGSSMRANCVYQDRLYFAGTQSDEKLKDGESVALSVIRRNAADDGWDTVADYTDFSYVSESKDADGNTVETTGYYGTDSFVAATAGSPFWDMTAYQDEIYCTIPNMLGYVVFRGHPAKEGEKANKYGWVWKEVIGRDKNSPNNQGLSKTDKLGFTDANAYALGYQSVVGALGVYDGKLYAYDIDHTISAELAGIQGMLLMMTDPSNPTLSNYLKPLATTLNHPQTLWRMDADTYQFSEVEGFTELTKGTTNEYIWKHGVYNGEFYISTMDSKVIYNYLTRITGKSFAEMTPAEKERQINYIAEFVGKMVAGKLKNNEAEQFADTIVSNQPDDENVSPSKIDALKKKLTKFFTDISSMEQWQKLVLFGMAYLQARAYESPELDEAMTELNDMMTELATLDVEDEQAVKAFTEKYAETGNKLSSALEALSKQIEESPVSYALTDEEALQLKTTLNEICGTIKSIFNEDFATEITKLQDIVKAVKLYNEISNYVKNDKQGFDIYKTTDGDNWEIVTDDGFGDKYNYGALRFVTTEEGMYITTANPFFGAQLYLLSNDKEPDPETSLNVENPTQVWTRDNNGIVSFKTDSASSWVTLRKDGKLYGTEIKNGCTIKDGVVTLNATLLASLDNGKNKLSLTTEEGSADVRIYVYDTAKEAVPVPPALILGDANLDGKVNVDDVTTIQKHLSGYHVLTDYALETADADGDGTITIDDATVIQKHLASMPIIYPVGKNI